MLGALLIALVASAVALKPAFDVPSVNVTLVSGTRDKGLDCQAEGGRPYQYKWYKEDGEEISRDIRMPVHVRRWTLSSDLQFVRVGPEDEGSYTCEASNSQGVARKVYHLRVVPDSSGLKPEFESSTVNKTVEIGLPFLHLSCETEAGENPITYKWYNQDGQEIGDDIDEPVYVRRYHLLPSTLYFRDISTAQEGSYTCAASNANGQASKTYHLRVIPKGLRPEFSVTSQDVLGDAGGYLRVSCKAEGAPPITYNWFNQKSDEIEEATNGTIYTTNSSTGGQLWLTFEDLSRDDQGQYICTARNGYGQAEKHYVLDVLDPTGMKPEFSFSLDTVEGEAGKPLDIQCSAMGERPITYSWYTEGEDKIPEGDADGTSVRAVSGKKHSTLSFRSLSAGDGGTYTCTASNAHGLASKVFQLKVV